MPARKQTVCGLKGCGNLLGPGSADVGYEIDGLTENVRVCPKHSWEIMNSPSGSIRITPDRELKRIPARPIIIDLKGNK